MATHDYVIDNQSASAFRADLNSALQAIVTQNSSATAPVTLYPDMFWYDTANNQLKKRNEANSAWITLGTIDEGTGTFTPTGTAAIASQAEAEAGTDNTKTMTPLRVFQALKSLTIDVQEFATAGSFTWTKPADAVYSEILVVGGGAAGAAGTAPVMCGTIGGAGSGGAAGGTAILSKIASALGATETVTVGAANGTSSFGTHASATGATGATTPGVGSGAGAQAITGNLGGLGATNVSGGVILGTLGGSTLAGPGGRGVSNGVGTAGVRGGGGGGGNHNGTNATAGGAGGPGYIRIVTYCA